MKAVLLFLLTAVTTVCAAPTERIEKPAVLLLPAELAQGEDIVPTVLLRWDEDDPLAVHTVVVGGRLCTYGEVLVYAEDGREMPMIYPATMPLVPTGSKEVKKGETLRIGLYTLAFVQTLPPGDYYAIARFSDVYCRSMNVGFTTSKRWFTVSKSKAQKPNQALQPTRMLSTSAAEPPRVPSTRVADL
jgi:hypothetical protein